MNILRKFIVIINTKARFRNSSRKSLKRYQLKKIKNICNYAARLSPFFKKYFHDIVISSMDLNTFNAMPQINKSIMMENFNRYNTEGLDRDRLFEFSIYNDQHNIDDAYFDDMYSVGLSSGTSGSRGLCVYSKGENEFNIVRFLARNGMPAGLKKHRIMFALRNNVPAFNEVNRFGYYLVYFNYNTDPDEIIQAINNKNLNIISGSPTFLLILAPYANKIRQKIDVVISYAEILEEHTKNIIEKAFHTKVHQLYGGTEGYHAASCKYGNLHLNEDFLYFNLLPIPGRENIYNMVVTDLYRKTQPIINYLLNDMIELDTTPCRCGSSFRTVKRIIGRANDYFVLLKPNGERVIVYADFVCRSIISSIDGILEYKAIQKRPDEIEVFIEFADSSNHTTQLQKIKKDLLSLFQKYTTSLPKVSIYEKKIDFEITEKKKRIVRDFE